MEASYVDEDGQSSGTCSFSVRAMEYVARTVHISLLEL